MRWFGNWRSLRTSLGSGARRATPALPRNAFPKPRTSSNVFRSALKTFPTAGVRRRRETGLDSRRSGQSARVGHRGPFSKPRPADLGSNQRPRASSLPKPSPKSSWTGTASRLRASAFSDARQAKAFAAALGGPLRGESGRPGLGQGVLICQSLSDAEMAISEIMEKQRSARPVRES